MEATSSLSVEELLKEFAGDYLRTPAGQEHLGAYDRSRARAKENWARVQQAKRDGQDVTDLVLEGLLPHLNSPHNRERDAWIHVAPAITKDLRKWFENKGWANSEDWPSIASAVLALVHRAVDTPAEIGPACREFGASKYSKGIQSAFMSPILNALRPEEFLILNSKSFKTLRLLTGTKYSRKLSSYPEANFALQRLHKTVEPHLAELCKPNSLTCDVLDQFCHWLVAIKKAVPKKRIKTSATGSIKLDREDPSSTALVLSRLYEDESQRALCSTLMAEAIDLASRHGDTRWSISLFRRFVRLNVGRLLALELRDNALRLGLVLNPADDGTRDLVNREAVATEGFATTPPSALYTLPLEAWVANEGRIRPLFNTFIGLAAKTARKSPTARSYSPGVISYLETTLNRSLPRPSHDTSEPSEPVQMPAAIPIKTPRTVFKKVDYDLAGLLTYIDNGDIGLPDIQRPFVWSAAKVRDLFDSMYRGFPVGYLLFWENSEIQGTKAIGLDDKPRDVPSLLIVDGQQRLTSLYAVLRGKPVLDNNFRKTHVEIAFRPRDGRFEVSDAATRLDPEYISNVSELWTSNRSSYSIVNEFLKQLEGKRKVTDEDKEVIGHNLDRLFDLQKYPFTALEITPSVDEEAVSDIFVRINSEGVKLRQADFILTLLSVFWDKGRAALERFARESRTVPSPGGAASPFNYLIEPSPSQLLRTSIAVGFHRAKLRSVYQILRGKDVDTGRFSPERRDMQFARLKHAQEGVLNLTHWHQFIGTISSAGFRSGAFISSESALMYTYAFYLVGKLQCKANEHELQRLISRWFFMAALTGRYTGSAETTMESDLNRIRECTSPTPFIETLEKTIADTLTNDFWTITLPNDLESSSSRSPAWFAYTAAQNRLGSPVLFSDKRMWEAMDPTLRAKKKTLEAHHLFPKAWLEKNGFPERRHFNQIANFAHLEWPDNVRIGASPPSKYVPGLRKRFSDATWEKICRAHGLPDSWEGLAYPEFLAQRRALMANVIRNGFEALTESGRDPDLHDSTDTGTPSEQEAWQRIAALELALRQKIRDKYRGKWGDKADGQIQRVLGDTAWSAVERNREKYRRQYKTSPDDSNLEVLDFCYLGQLGQLMTANQAWELFRSPFRDKRELEDMIRSIVPVRNDGAHFRSVPERELMRCRLAVDDLTRFVSEM
jgi:hypothetical protein